MVCGRILFKQRIYHERVNSEPGRRSETIMRMSKNSGVENVQEAIEGGAAENLKR